MSPHDSHLNDLISQWQSAQESDNPASTQELCRHCPELLPELERRVAAIRHLNAVAQALRGTATKTPGLPSIGPHGFDLLEEVGHGGMGVVYRALDRALDREVAVKLLLDSYSPNSLAARRFVDEARITGQLQHPGIPAVYQVGASADGRPFLAMKLIKGQTLDGMLKSGAALDTLSVFESISQAVGYAHAHGVIHRDLKPSNIMVGAFGEVQVMDWGLAKVLTENGVPGRLKSDSETTTPRSALQTECDSESPFTQYGSVLGTLAFMAPEQAAGELDQIDERADVFGLGAILCTLLTGHPPYEGKDAESLRIAAVRGQTAAAFARLEASVADPGVVALCRRCLAIDLATRPATAEAVAVEVAALRRAADERVRQAERNKLAAEVLAAEQAKRRRAVQWAAAVVAAVLLMGVAGTGIGLYQTAAARLDADRNASKFKEQRDAADHARADAVQATAEKQRQLIRSHVGTGLRFLDTGDSESALLWYNRAWQEDEAKEHEAAHRLRLGLIANYRLPIAGLAIESHPLIRTCTTSTGDKVMTLTQAGTVSIWDPFAGRRLFALPCPSPITAIALSTDGRTAVTGSVDGSVCVWDAVTGRLAVTFNHGAAVECVALCPNGPLLATAGGADGVKLTDRNTGRPAQSPKVPGAYFVVFSPDGAALATADESGHARAWDCQTWQPLTAPLAHGRQTKFEKQWNYRPGPVFTPDGAKLLTVDWANGKPSKSFALTLWNLRDGKSVWGPVKGPGGYQNAFSADGKRLLGAGITCQILDAERGTVLAVLRTTRECNAAAFVGPTSVVTASTGGTLWRWELTDGQLPTRSPLTAQTADSIRQLTPLGNGRHVLAGAADGTARVYDALPHLARYPFEYDSGRANQFSLVMEDRSIRVFSPDGKNECHYGRGQTARFGPRGTAPLPVALQTEPPVTVAEFSADGRVLVTCDGGAIRTWDAQSGRAIGTFPFLSEGSRTFDVSPDGRRVVVGHFRSSQLYVLDLQSGQVHLNLAFEGSSNAQDDEEEVHGMTRSPPFGVFSPDGRWLACHDGLIGGIVQVWNLETRKLLSEFRPQRGWINGNITFTPDGSCLFIASSDTTARLWQATTGTPAGPILRHTTFCRRGRLSPDGRLAVTCNSRGVVSIWNPWDGEFYGPLPITNSTWAAFGADARRVILPIMNSIHEYNIHPLAVATERVEPLIVLLTGKRIDRVTDGVEFVPAEMLYSDPERYLAAWLEWNRLRTN